MFVKKCFSSVCFFSSVFFFSVALFPLMVKSAKRSRRGRKREKKVERDFDVIVTEGVGVTALVVSACVSFVLGVSLCYGYCHKNDIIGYFANEGSASDVENDPNPNANTEVADTADTADNAV